MIPVIDKLSSCAITPASQPSFPMNAGYHLLDRTIQRLAKELLSIIVEYALEDFEPLHQLEPVVLERLVKDPLFRFRPGELALILTKTQAPHIKEIFLQEIESKNGRVWKALWAQHVLIKTEFTSKMCNVWNKDQPNDVSSVDLPGDQVRDVGNYLGMCKGTVCRVIVHRNRDLGATVGRVIELEELKEIVEPKQIMLHRVFIPSQDFLFLFQEDLRLITRHQGDLLGKKNIWNTCKDLRVPCFQEIYNTYELMFLTCMEVLQMKGNTLYTQVSRTNNLLNIPKIAHAFELTELLIRHCMKVLNPLNFDTDTPMEIGGNAQLKEEEEYIHYLKELITIFRQFPTIEKQLVSIIKTMEASNEQASQTEEKNE